MSSTTSTSSTSSTSVTSATEQYIPNQIFVTPSNFAYSLKMEPKLEPSTSTATVVTRQPDKIFKQETNNNQNSTKQRIIYEIATEASGI